VRGEIERALCAHPRGTVSQVPGTTPWRAVYTGLVHCIYLYNRAVNPLARAFACPGLTCEADTGDYYYRSMPPLHGAALVPDAAVVTCLLCAGATYPENAEGDLEDDEIPW
jgi:hypothetical protein